MADILREAREAFNLNDDRFKSIVNGFISEYNSGLQTASASGLATMIPSFVTSLPKGNEKGTYLSLDLGGSTLRISAVELEGQGNVKVTEIKRHIAPNDPLRTCHVITFFDWMVDTIAELIQKIGHQTNPQKPLSLGVCWSFPVDQTSIGAGKILRMGKGFTISEIEGHDLSTLFNEAFQRKGLHVKVTALLNDTVGTLVAHAYTNPKCRVGFIYGTGVNAAYPEKVSRMVKLQGHHSEYPEGTTMLVNTEIDIFGSDAYLPLNKYDLELDANHSQPQFQLYEKMMSGAYIGELVRLAAIDLIRQGELFNGHQPTEFNVALEFGTSVVSDIEGHLDDSTEQRLEQFRDAFHFDGYELTEADMNIITELCQIVSSRAARLAGAAMASLIEQQEELLQGTDPIVIGVTGSTYEKYPKMHERIHQSLVSWFEPKVSERIKIETATDGGSIGGALIAMLAEKEANLIPEKMPNKATLPIAKNHPSSPSFFGCLFGWLGPLRTKKGDSYSDISETLKQEEKI